ncbi:MAG TPA: Ada metal-binding domain-containing protein [Candidatus Paceibacterota bacterium]
MFRLRSIDHIGAKIKGLAEKGRGGVGRAYGWIDCRLNRWDVYTVAIAVLVGIISGFSGLIWGTRTARPPVRIERFALEAPVPAAATQIEPETTTKPTADSSPKPLKTYVASKSGTKYHLPSCSSAKSISEANKVWFATKEEAEKAGYSPAGNCKGLQQ